MIHPAERWVNTRVVFHEDIRANAATIKYVPVDQVGGRRVTYPITDSAGSVIATISFNSETGKLSEVELLDAAVQLPDGFR